MKQLKFLVLSLGLVALVSCETVDAVMEDFGEVDVPRLISSDPDSEELVLNANCPKVQIIDELSVLSEFADSANTQTTNMISRAHLSEIKTACAYGTKSVTVDLKILFDGQLGPKARLTNNDKPFFSYPFFVAVTEPGGDILAKEVFAASMTYGAGQDTQTYTENLRQIIPVPSQSRGSKYKVLVGFQLSESQLAHNRALIKQAEAAAAAAKKAPQ